MAAGVLLGPSAPFVPAPLVDGPIRGEIGLPLPGGLAGGAAGPGPAVVPALRPRPRAIASGGDHHIAAWGERSPGAPSAQRRGAPGAAVPTT
jgi:hypothetical protein